MKAKPLIESLIRTIRGHQVVLAADLAKLYGVETRSLNQAVKRNAERFPEDFMFQLTSEEWTAQKAAADSQGAQEGLKSQIVMSKRGGIRRALPYAFTEHGAIMAATVLNSPEAVTMSVYVVRAFVQMRQQIATNTQILKRLAEIDQSLLQHDKALQVIWQKLQPLLQPPPEAPKRRIGFHP